MTEGTFKGKKIMHRHPSRPTRSASARNYVTTRPWYDRWHSVLTLLAIGAGVMLQDILLTNNLMPRAILHMALEEFAFVGILLLLGTGAARLFRSFGNTAMRVVIFVIYLLTWCGAIAVLVLTGKALLGYLS